MCLRDLFDDEDLDSGFVQNVSELKDIIDPSTPIIDEVFECEFAQDEDGRCQWAYQDWRDDKIHCKLIIGWFPFTQVENLDRCFKGKYFYKRDKVAATNRLRKKFIKLEDRHLSY